MEFASRQALVPRGTLVMTGRPPTVILVEKRICYIDDMLTLGDLRKLTAELPDETPLAWERVFNFEKVDDPTFIRIETVEHGPSGEYPIMGDGIATSSLFRDEFEKGTRVLAFDISMFEEQPD